MKDFMQTMREKEQSNLFSVYNHIKMEEIGTDYAIFSLEICPESKNGFGTVHGGAIFSMADNATGFAAHTDGRQYVTQNGALHFLSNQTEGTVYARAKVRHRGRKTCLVTVDITGNNEKLIATGEFSFFCVKPSIDEEKK